MESDKNDASINRAYFWSKFIEREDSLVSTQFQVIVVRTNTVITTSLNVDCSQVQSKRILASEEIPAQLKRK